MDEPGTLISTQTGGGQAGSGARGDQLGTWFVLSDDDTREESYLSLRDPQPLSQNAATVLRQRPLPALGGGHTMVLVFLHYPTLTSFTKAQE